jgi:cytoskeletal protein CcmA (bactofilin family)
MFRRGKAPRRSELTAFIDEGSEIEGRYTFRGTVMLNGKFKGEISSNDTLIIGERAVLHADVRAGRLVVNGEVTGNLSAMERIELKRTARVYGDVEAPVVVLEEGVLFEGHCRMAKPSALAEVPPRDLSPARDLSVLPLKR